MSDRLTQEQREAIECRDLDILVEAGAGSGKTSTTVSRYEHLISTPDKADDTAVEPGEILVFTFTDKAATELRNRVRELRGKPGSLQGSNPSFSMSSAWIGTFHSICSRILRNHPVAANIDPQFTVLDDVGSKRIKDSAYDRALGVAMDSAERVDLIARFTPSELRKGVMRAHEQLRARGWTQPKLPAPSPPDLEAALGEVRKLAGEALEIEKIQTKTRDKVAGMSEFIDSADAGTVTMSAFEAARSAFSNSSSYLTDLNQAVDRAYSAVATVEVGGVCHSMLDALLTAYATEYASIKQRSGMLDYEDLQLLTLDLLRQNTGIAAHYRERFMEIMVDEFQDTNRLQLDLIEALRGPGTRLFTVGDEMQAIYGFRHADVQLFRSRRAARGVTRLRLSANFRSQYPVLGAINLIGEKLDQQARGYQGEQRSLTRHKFDKLRVGLGGEEIRGDEVEYLMTRDDGWSDLDLGSLSPAAEPGGPKKSATDEACWAEAMLLARHIKLLIEDGQVSAGDVAVLFRAKARMWMHAEALKQVGVTPYMVGGSGFWKAREGIDLRALLGVLANPLDDDSLIGALAGPSCGLSTSGLWLLRDLAGFDQPLWPALSDVEENGGPEGFPDEDRKRSATFVRMIREIRERMAFMSLTELVESTTVMAGYDLVSTMRDQTGTGIANIRRIQTLAAEFEASEGRDLRGFLDWITVSSEIDSEAAVATEEEENDVVRLMTVHKAKGLQFDMVCIPELGRNPKSPMETVFWLGTDPENPDSDELRFGLRIPQPDGSSLDLFEWNSLAEEARVEVGNEELRLFHVALTRARRRLVMSGVSDFTAPEIESLSSMASRLNTAFEKEINAADSVKVPAAEALAEVEPKPKLSSIEIRQSEADEDQAEYLAHADRATPATGKGLVGRPPLRRPEAARQPDVPLSFTALNELRECPARFYASRILKVDEPELPWVPLDPEEQSPNLQREATSFGTAVHEILEICARRRWIRPTDNEMAAILDRNGAARKDTKALGRAVRMVDGFLDSGLASQLSGHRCDLEIPLLLDVRGVTVRGFADLLCRDCSPPLILDYKTNRLDGKSPETKMDDYRLQRDLYGLAVARALKTDLVQTAFVFLEAPDMPVELELGPAELVAAERHLEGLVDLIRAGAFFGTDEDQVKPCGECWACERLGSQIVSTRLE